MNMFASFDGILKTLQDIEETRTLQTLGNNSKRIDWPIPYIFYKSICIVKIKYVFEI